MFRKDLAEVVLIGKRGLFLVIKGMVDLGGRASFLWLGTSLPGIEFFVSDTDNPNFTEGVEGRS